MRTSKRVARAIVIVLGFTYGLLAGLAVPDDVVRSCDVLSGENPFVIAIAVACCASASRITAYIVAASLRGWPQWVLFLVALFYFALPALAVGTLLSAVLGWLGLLKVPYSLAVASLLGASHLSAGIAGIIATKSIPEYHCLYTEAESTGRQETKG